VLGVDVMSKLHFSLQDWLNSMSKSLLVWVCASASWLALHYSNYYWLPTFGRTQQQFTPRPPVSNFLLISCQFISALLLKPTVVHIVLTSLEGSLEAMPCSTKCFSLLFLIGLLLHWLGEHCANGRGFPCSLWLEPPISTHPPGSNKPSTKSLGFRFLRPRCPLIGDNLLTQLLVLKFTYPFIILG
jgi:hypothetical protein